VITVTLDAGALIAIERRSDRGRMLLQAAKEHRAELVAITPTLAEWWRGRTDARDRIKLAVTIVPLPVRAAEAAGVALGKLKKVDAALSIDAMVMAFAATYGGGVVYTSDVVDLERLIEHFPSVRVLGV
jgi:predicted nucleic acid-binding protein